MFLSYSIENKTRGTEQVVHQGRSYSFKSPCQNKDPCTPYIVNLKPGKYSLEAWGSAAQTSSNSKVAGYGAYVRGEIYFQNNTKLFLYIGSKSMFNSVKHHTASNGHGGGASDVRLQGGEWDDFDSLKSRILVAGGGGGSEWPMSFGGNGGGLEGGSGTFSKLYTGPDIAYSSGGGKQDSPGFAEGKVLFENYIPKYGYAGGFGFAGSNSSSTDLGGIGGGGYYGGSSMDYAGAGGGGSSFISGHEGCDAIHVNSTEDNISHTHQSVHYSLHFFRNTVMIQGNMTMPLLSTPKDALGNKDLGSIKITAIPFVVSCKKGYFQISLQNFLLLFLAYSPK